MKKFMAVGVMLLLAGCATQNPYYKTAQVLGGTVAGAVVGAKVLHGGVLGGLVGAVAGGVLVKGAQWKPGDPEIIYIDGAQGSGYGNGAGDSCYDTSCDRTPPGGMAPLEYGKCMDHRTGGRIDDWFLQQNPRYQRCGIIEPRPSAMSSLPSRKSYAPRQSASTQPVTYPANMWERGDRKMADAKKAAKVVVGPTVNNYLDEPMIHKTCKTGNHGHDGKCLLKLSTNLAKEQKDCEEDSKKCFQYNAGKWAGVYNRLGNELVALQKEEQGGTFSTD